MQSAEQIRLNVGEKFSVISAEVIAQDPILEALVDERMPNAVIGLPDFPGITYLRTRTLEMGHGWGGCGTVVAHELGYYYDQQLHALIDFQGRQDGEIVPTEFVFSTTHLRHMRTTKKEDL